MTLQAPNKKLNHYVHKLLQLINFVDASLLLKRMILLYSNNYIIVNNF